VLCQRLDVDVKIFSGPLVPFRRPWVNDVFMRMGKLNFSIFRPAFRLTGSIATMLAIFSAFGACTEFDSDPFVPLPEDLHSDLDANEQKQTLPSAKKLFKKIEKLARSQSGYNNSVPGVHPTEQYGPLDGGEVPRTKHLSD